MRLEPARRPSERCCGRASSKGASRRGEVASSGFRVGKVSKSFFPRTAVWTDVAGDIPAALRGRSRRVAPSPPLLPFGGRRSIRRVPESTTCLHHPALRVPSSLLRRIPIGTTRSVLRQQVGRSSCASADGPPFSSSWWASRSFSPMLPPTFSLTPSGSRSWGSSVCLAMRSRPKPSCTSSPAARPLP
jgi:hypothetical protein